jgi:hypothetical protein
VVRTTLLVVALVALLSGCQSRGATNAEPAAAPPAEAAAVVHVIAAGPHVTGLPYPAHCVLGKTAAGKVLPDPTCTPGAASDAVTQDNIKTTICVTHYTKRPGIRAPVSETEPVKRAAMRAYGEAPVDIKTTELDHLVPLEVGGSNDASNLWPQPSDLLGHNPPYANTKDGVESALHAAVCSGKARLVDAQNAIATNWTTARQTLGLK